MSSKQEVRIPNIGDFADVEVIEVLVKKGDTINPEDPLITLESDKASITVPSPLAGKVREIRIAVGDKVSAGDLILLAETETAAAAAIQATTANPAVTGTTAAAAASRPTIKADLQAELLVLGSGPGGYTAAFRAADLGIQTVLVERYPALGGVCLNVGCIPSKALLHAARVISDSKEAQVFGIDFGDPKIDIDTLRGWKDKVLGQLTNGLKGLAKQRKVEVVHGAGEFLSPHELKVATASSDKIIAFEQAIIAVGSQAITLPDFPDDPRIINSTGALELQNIPGRLLVIGGGIIGLEMATVYHALGAKVTVVEALDRLIAGADADIVKPLHRRIQKQYANLYLGAKVTGVTAGKDELIVSFKGEGTPASASFDCVLVAVGRRPNGLQVGAERAGVNVDKRGYIPVDKQQRTNVPHIFAIGDVVGQPMLAHKAVHEGKVAAEVAAGWKSEFNARVIPSVAYTDPEVAWVGVTEEEAQVQGLNFGKGVFPWAASGRSLTLGRNEGMTKLLFDADSKTIIGAGIVGPNAGDLIAEAALAIEMGCDAEDIGLTIHPHPTLSETVAFSAEAFAGTITDLYLPKK
ncbi:MAG: dihydrolipoyl dehydrogenase [Gammaproteobacteria bacterium RIFCSPLOWO2_12_FULL_52_10]|nr:MAG: dihydrolipoyl dehydrogenase [Gammaproteobacteria bacterium RIFCSPLOWO2_12_FULL_52_10]